MKDVQVDLDRCVGHGKCYMVAPELFEAIDDDGRAAYVGDPVDPTDTDALARVQKAIGSCPEAAIALIDLADAAASARQSHTEENQA